MKSFSNARLVYIVWRGLSAATVVFLIAVLLISTATAQPSERDRRRQFFEGLFQTLVETQLERHLAPPARPAQPSRPGVPAATAQIIQARKSLAAFGDESGRVLEALQTDASRVPGVRPLLGDMLRLRADSVVLARQADAGTSLDPLAEPVQGLDRQWRLIHYRLGQLDGLSNNCRQCVERLHAIDRQLCQLFNIQAQIDGRELLRLADSLSAELADLAEDIGIELGRTRDGQALLLEARRVQQQARYFSDAISRKKAYETIVAEFQRFHGAYTQLATKLWPMDNRYLERGMRRIEESDRELHTLLLLPQPLNRQHLLHLTSVLTQRVDELFDKVTLNMLVASPSTRNVLNTASQFYGCCENLALAVDEEETPAGLRLEFGYLQAAWPELAFSFRSIRHPEVNQALQEIERTFVSLREALQVPTEFDRRTAVDAAAALESQLDHLARDVRMHVNSLARFSPAQRQQAIQAAEALHFASRALLERMAEEEDLDRLRRDCSDLRRAWAEFHEQHLNRMALDSDSHLHETADQITPLIVQLQTLLPYEAGT